MCMTCLIPTGEVTQDFVLYPHHQLMMLFIQLPAHGPLPHFIPVLVSLRVTV